MRIKKSLKKSSETIKKSLVGYFGICENFEEIDLPLASSAYFRAKRLKKSH
jgi:hypothetical protein